MRAPMRLGGMPAIGGGSLLATLIVIVLVKLLGGGGGGGGGDPTGGGGPLDEPSSSTRGLAPGQDPDRELYEFVNFALDDIQGSFAEVFERQGMRYEPARLVVFSDAVESGCGIAGSEVGPFYCPNDRKAYVDLSFYRVLRDKLGAGGDFAQAYVLAHEIGHHVQNLTGQNRKHSSRDNETSVRMELQADCLAGVWAHSTDQRRLLESGDIEESMNAAEQIGDDRLQQRAGRRVNPETFTHGTSAQRQKWFARGLHEGDMRACDTFSGDI
jgi:uncharacterized protein